MNLQVQQEYAYTSYKLAPRASAPPRALPAKPERGFFLSDHHQAALPGGLFHWETAMNVPNEPNLPSEGQFGISIPEGFVPEEPETDAEPSAEEPPASEPPEPPPAGELPPQELPPQEPPPQEPPIVRHDPFAHIRTAPWMNRALDASGRAAAFLRRLLQDFAAIEGRQPNRADLDDIVKRTTDYMIPIFKRERATDAAYDELEKRRAARIAAAAAAVSASRAVAASSSLLRTPVPAAGPLTAATLMVTPTNSQNSTVDFGGGLRGDSGPAERTVRLQRRVPVLLKYGLEFSDWKDLPVPMVKDEALGGLEVLLVDPGPLVQAIGSEAAARLLARPGVIGMEQAAFDQVWTGPIGPLEIQIPTGTSEDKGKKVTYRELSRKEIERACPNLPIYERLGARAHAEAQRETGLPYGPVVGTKTHAWARRAADLIADKLRARGLAELHTEQGLRRGETSFEKGHVRVDVLEIYEGREACIIDYKTGGATMDDRQVRRYIRQAGLYIQAQKLGYKRIYFVPIHLP
jgi:hypothetical protein